MSPAVSTPRTLAELLSGGGLGADAVDLLRPVAAELDAWHDEGRMHGCLRPAGIALAADGAASLSHGVVPHALPAPQGTTSDSTLDAEIEPVYRAPEQDRRPVTSHRSDVYSFGCVMYEAVTGHPAFTTATPDARASGSPPAVAGRLPGTPDAVDAVLAVALAPAPEDRPSSATQVVEALGAAFGRAYRPAAGQRLKRLVAVSAVTALLATTAAVLAAALTLGAADAPPPADPTTSAEYR